MNREILKGHLPALILGLLSRRPLHGYAICREIAERGGTWLDLGEGTIYPLLYRLERNGEIRAKWEQGDGGRPRKVYHITTSGRRAIQQHRAEWLRLADAFAAIAGEKWGAT